MIGLLLFLYMTAAQNGQLGLAAQNPEWSGFTMDNYDWSIGFGCGIDGNDCIKPWSSDADKTIVTYCWVIGDYNSCDPPMDVPAIKHERRIENGVQCWVIGDKREVPYDCRPVETTWTCADKSRVLLTSEDQKKHCVKF